LLEPADRTRADAAEDDPPLIGIAHDRIQTPFPPEGEQVPRAAAADVNDILIEEQPGEVVRRGLVEREVSGRAVEPAGGIVEAVDPLLPIAGRRADIANLRRRRRRQAEDV